MAKSGPTVAEMGKRQDIGAQNRANADGILLPATEPYIPERVVVGTLPPTPIRWLWKLRIARGKLTIVGGHPGVNKSTAVLDIAARITTGASWPNNEGRAPPGSVVVLSAEDDVADTIHPRLLAAGADVMRVHVITAMVKPGDRRGFDLTRDIEQLEKVLREIGDVALVIIDPISAYMGQPGKLDSHRNTDVRATLEPLGLMAARCDVAVIAIHHLTKAGDAGALMRFLGSIAFVAVARGVYLVARDEEDKTRKRRLFLPAKNNIGDDISGLAFNIVVRPATVDISVIAAQWEDGTVSITADEAMERLVERKQPRLAEAKDFLLDILANGPVPVTTVEERAAQRGIADKTLRNARKALGVEARKISGKEGWEMILPGGPGTPADLILGRGMR